MNLPHALGFFVLGLAMIVLPELAPALASPNALGDTTTLWLEVMGTMIFLIGSGYTAKGLAAALPKAPVSGETAAVPATGRVRERSSLAADGNQATV